MLEGNIDMFKEKFNKSIRFKFLSVMSVILFVGTLVISLVIAINEGKVLKNSLMTTGQSLASYIAKLGRDPLLMKDSIQLDAIVTDANKDENIAYTIIRDGQGAPLTSQYASINYRLPRFNAILLELSRDHELQDIIDAIKKKESVIEVSTPIMIDIKTIGAVTIGMSTHKVHQQIVKTILFVIALNVAVAFVLGAVLFVASKKIVFDPLIELAHASSRLAKGDLSTLVKVRTTGEVKTLVDSFNEMVKNLEKVTVSKDYVDNIIRSMINTLIVVSPDDKIIRANDAACRLLGYEEEELIGRPAETIFGGERSRKDSWMKTMLADGRVGNIEESYRAKNGREFPVLFSASVMRDDNNLFRGAVYVAQDITERKRAENRLAKLNECFLNFGSNSEENINRLVANCGELMNAACALYNCLEGNILRSVGEWNAPPGFNPVDTPEGHICYDVIQQSLDSPVVIRNLQNTPYFQTDPNVKQYGLHTYVGMAVKLRQIAIGSLCVVYQADIEPSPEELNLMSIIATAIGVEEERKRSLQTIQQSEERYRTILENIEEGYFEADIAGNYTFFNDSLCRMLGYSRDEMVGMNNRQYTDQENAKKVFQAFNKVYRTGESTKEFDWEIIRKDGTKQYIESSVSLIKNISGQPVGFRGIVRNITERKQAEEALLQSEERFRQLYDEAPVGYHEYDSEGRITRVNHTDLEILGYTAEEMIGQPIWKFNIEEELVHQQILEKLAGSRPPGRGIERTYRRKDGTTFPVLIEDRIIRGENGRITGIRVTIQDITERKKTEEEKTILQEQLRQSQKMEAIGSLAGGIAHDFNNLLTVIKGYSQLSLVEIKEGDPLKLNIEEIRRAADRAADLTRQLLAFSRRQIMEMKVLDLNDLLKNLDKMLRRVIGEDIELVTLLAEDLGRVKTDPAQTEQVVMNLSVNARDAMPNGGKLTVETANVDLDQTYARAHVAVAPGRFVMISVSDTGVGMTPEVRDRVFEPFFTTKEKGKGTGLGLSTVYGIVKQSNGNIWVYSEPGKGTTFKIYLPRVDEPLEELGERVEVKEIPRGTETILVVEDEEDVRKLAVRILERQGYKVLEASQGLDAFLIAEKYEDLIHLLVTDVVMPKISGRELADRIAEIRPEIKVLYMSGYTDNAIVHHGVLREGMKFIQKPFTVEGLARKVREVLDKDLKPVV